MTLQLDSPSAGQPLLGDVSPNALLRLRSKIHHAMIAELDGRSGRPDANWVSERVRALLGPMATAEGIVPTPRVRNQLVTDVVDEIFGFGPIQSLLDDPSVNEI